MSGARSGILLLDKRPGMTSFDCIRELKRAWRRTDLGHGGTLDRFASGLLPILVGEGLKLVRFFLESYPALSTYWKSYEGVFEMGMATETGDPEGAVTETRPAGELSRERVAAAMAGFVNRPYEQVPPKYSAKKVGGARASDLARQGIAADLKPVSVTVRSFELLGAEGTQVRFKATCSKGTYIRRLGEDLAAQLGTVAHVRELRRTAIGDFRIDEAVLLKTQGSDRRPETGDRRLERQAREKDERGNSETGETVVPESAILDMDRATAFLPSFPLIGGELERLEAGRVDRLAIRLANSGLQPGVYRATARVGDAVQPVALLEMAPDCSVKFLRALNR